MGWPHTWRSATTVLVFWTAACSAASGDESAANPLNMAARVEGALVDLRADVNRNGTIDLGDATEDQNEDAWSLESGAIFLANIDDDDGRCPKSGTDEELAGCNDAADDVVNGKDDELDLAPLRARPIATVSDAAVGSLDVPEPGRRYVRIFRETPDGLRAFDLSSDRLSAQDLRAGLRLAIEGKDIVRDEAVWDGSVDVTLSVIDDGRSLGTDTVRLHVAPVVTPSHLDAPEEIFVSNDKDLAQTKWGLQRKTSCRFHFCSTPSVRGSRPISRAR